MTPRLLAVTHACSARRRIVARAVLLLKLLLGLMAGGVTGARAQSAVRPFFVFGGAADPKGSRFGVQPAGIATGAPGVFYVTVQGGGPNLVGGITRLANGKPATRGAFDIVDFGSPNSRVVVGIDGVL